MPAPIYGDVQVSNLSKLMDVAQLRAKVHAANIANQNTPGYHAKRVAFEDSFREALVAGKPADEIDPVIFEPRNTAEQPDGNDVSVDREVLDQAENSTLYNTYLAMIQGKKKLLTIAISTAPGG